MSRILYRRFEDGDAVPEGVTILNAWARDGGGISAIVLEEDADKDGVLKHHHDCDEHGCWIASPADRVFGVDPEPNNPFHRSVIDKETQ